MISSSLPLRAAIAQSRLLSPRYRKQLLRQYDFVLLAIVDLCRAEPDWSAGKVSASLQGTCPGLQERTVAELRKVIGAKHAKRRGGVAMAVGPDRRRLRIGVAGFMLGAWYRGREPGVPIRQFVGVIVSENGEMMTCYRMSDRPRVFRVTFRSWNHWVGGEVLTAAGGRTMPEIGLMLQVPQGEPVECEAA